LPAQRLGAKMKKQSQFSECENRRKLNVGRGLCERVAPAVPPEQSQFEPNLLQDRRDRTGNGGHQMQPHALREESQGQRMLMLFATVVICSLPETTALGNAPEPKLEPLVRVADLNVGESQTVERGMTSATPSAEQWRRLTLTAGPYHSSLPPIVCRRPSPACRLIVLSPGAICRTAAKRTRGDWTRTPG
jgi:hypothetical protein